MRALVLALVAGCARAAPPPVAAADGLPGPALVEWQFPLAPGLRVDPRQAALAGESTLAPALHPHLSEQNTEEGEAGLARLVRHAERVAKAYAAGRERYAAPFLVNISDATPRALEAILAEGVRVVSISSGSKEHLAGLDAVVAGHPDVLFVAATPHVAGNTTSVAELGERPSVLALSHPNVVLAGCLEFGPDDGWEHVGGKPLGSAENPFWVDNQPVGGEARQVFLLSCRAAGTFVDGPGGTSTAAPLLAALLQVRLEDEVARGRSPTAADLLGAIEGVAHRGLAQEEDGAVREVPFVTLDTLLVNTGRPAAPAYAWPGLGESPVEPIRFAP